MQYHFAEHVAQQEQTEEIVAEKLQIGEIQSCSGEQTGRFGNETVHKRLATFPMMDGYAVDVATIAEGG